MTILTFDLCDLLSMVASRTILLKCLSMILARGMAIQTFEPIACDMGFMRKFDIVEGNDAFLDPHMAESRAGHPGFILPDLVTLIDCCENLFGLIIRCIEELDGIFNIMNSLAEEYKTVIVACLIEEVLSFSEVSGVSPGLFKFV
jgi:hypothetical protein